MDDLLDLGESLLTHIQTIHQTRPRVLPAAEAVAERAGVLMGRGHQLTSEQQGLLRVLEVRQDALQAVAQGVIPWSGGGADEDS